MQTITQSFVILVFKITEIFVDLHNFVT